jgi:hypothetical protein
MNSTVSDQPSAAKPSLAPGADNGPPLGVCVLPEAGMNRPRTVEYPDYIFEILEHAGVFHLRVAIDDLDSALDRLGLLVTVGDAELPEALRNNLAKWVAAGGAWLSVAGLCGMEALLGATRQEPLMWSWAGGLRSLGEGYFVSLDPDHRALAQVNRPLHLFGGITVAPDGATVLARVNDKHNRPSDRPGLLEHAVGRGRTMLLAADVTGTIVRIQQGVGVTRDGVPAPDGSAPINDRVLKSDDGAVLDWDLDRDPVPGVKNFLAFVEPIADAWRELLLGCIFHLALERKIALPVLWLYPRRLAALAHMSHDTDSNEPEKCDRLLELLDEANVRTTWCVIIPGYDAGRIARIKAAGHELATHYDAISPGLEWSQAEWQRQYALLRELFGEAPVSNKNHVARWEGDSEFWDWCVALGVQLEQSKASSKTGECGYNFGTCHPYFPVTFTGRRIDCLELCTPLWDLHVFAPVETFDALLTSVRRHHGILHQLFHPYHVPRPEVAESLVDCVRRARGAGLEWWTARQINQWERSRRGVKLERYSRAGDGVSLTLRSPQPLADATILCLSAKPAAPESALQAWGFSFAASVESIEPGQSVTVQF